MTLPIGAYGQTEIGISDLFVLNMVVSEQVKFCSL